MQKTVKCVLFIDDDTATNFIHKRIAEKSQCFDNVITVPSGKEALQYLEKVSKGALTHPQLIFLDLNMPAMNGWEFLEKYKHMPAPLRKRIKVFILSSSAMKKDINRAKEYADVIGFLNKPFTQKALNELMKDENGFELN